MIKVLLVLTKPELGGAQTHVQALLEGIDKERYSLELFTARDGYLAQRFSNIPGIRVHFSSFLKRSFSPVNDLIALFELFFYIRKNGVDVVHTHSSKAGILGRLAARLAGVKFVVHTVHGWSFHDHQLKFIFEAGVLLERFCARFTDVLVVVSSWDRDRGIALGIKPRGYYVLIRCGIRHQDYQDVAMRRQIAREDLGLDPKCPVIGTVACFKPQKDPMAFLRLASGLKKEFRGLKFLMVGDGILRPQISSFLCARGLDSDVILTGWREDVPALLAAMDVFVLTSLWEGLPVVVLEAMSAGIPVVATDTGGVRDVIVPGMTGELAGPGDEKMMMQKIIVLLKNEELRCRLAGQGVLKVTNKEFFIEETVKSIEQVYVGSLQRSSLCPVS